MLKIITGLIVLLAFSACDTAMAQSPVSSLATYFESSRGCLEARAYTIESKDAPARLAANFTHLDNKGLVFVVCTGRQGGTRYFTRLPTDTPTYTAVGDAFVCRLKESEILPGAATDKVWVDGELNGFRSTLADGYTTDGTGLAQITDRICPPASDSRYIPTGNITDSMLISFYRIWRQAVSSDAAFNAAIPLRAGAPEAYVVRRQMVRENLVKNHAPILSITCGNKGCEANVGNGFTLKFDIIDGKLVLQGFEIVISVMSFGSP